MAYGIATDASGNIYITGYAAGNLDANVNAGSYDAFIAKYDTTGAKQWTKLLGSVGDDRAYGIAVDASANVFITGYTSGTLDGNAIAGSYDAFVAKYDTTGAKQWTKLLGSAGYDMATGAAVDASGNVYITGYTNGNLAGGNSGSYDAFIAKYDTTGVIQWSRLLGTPGVDYSTGIAIDTSGNVYFTGYTNGSLDHMNAGGFDAFITKISTDGTFS